MTEPRPGGMTGPADLIKLLELVRESADPAARELAARVAEAIQRPNRPIADAFRIESSRGCRDRIMRDLAGEGSLRQQAEVIRQKARRYRPHPTDRVTPGERRLLWQLNQIGSLDLSERQIRRILGGR